MPASTREVALVMPGRGRRNRLTIYRRDARIDPRDARIDRRDPLAGAGWTDGT